VSNRFQATFRLKPGAVAQGIDGSFWLPPKPRKIRLRELFDPLDEPARIDGDHVLIAALRSYASQGSFPIEEV
jgi:hypothetical protein